MSRIFIQRGRYYFFQCTTEDRKRVPTRPRWAAAVWTVPFIERRDQSVEWNAARSAVKPSDRQLKATRAYRLPHGMSSIRRTDLARWTCGQAVLLAGCYQNCLRIASELNCKNRGVSVHQHRCISLSVEPCR